MDLDLDLDLDLEQELVLELDGELDLERFCLLSLECGYNGDLWVPGGNAEMEDARLPRTRVREERCLLLFESSLELSQRMLACGV